MKLLENLYAFKTVEYFGHKLIVPNWTEYLACDSDGCLHAHRIKPDIVKDIWGYGEEIIAIFSLEGVDWKDTLVDVE